MKVVHIPRQSYMQWLVAVEPYATTFEYSVTCEERLSETASFVTAVGVEPPNMVPYQHIAASTPEEAKRRLQRFIETGQDPDPEIVRAPQESFWLWWPTDYRGITQLFGANPQNYTRFGLPGHEGLDIEIRRGSPIYAGAPGRVKRVIRSYNAAYGFFVHLEHTGGYATIYAHLEPGTIVVKPGQFVARRQVLGGGDNTGNSSGDHLHITVKKRGATAAGETIMPGDQIDPLPLMRNRPQ